MRTPVPLVPCLSGGSFVSLHLRAAERELQDVLFEMSVGNVVDQSEVVPVNGSYGLLDAYTVILQLDALEEQAFAIISLIRYGRNSLAPVSRLPPDVLTLIPDFFGGRERDKIVITLSHICRDWREVFVSRASMWTHFRCTDAEKTHIYLERSGSSPIDLCLERKYGLSPGDPFLEIFPDAIGRLKRLFVKTTPNHLQGITELFFFDTIPLLEVLEIDGSAIEPQLNPTLPEGLLNGNFSPLHELHLHSIRTQLPWKHMDNLTHFSLTYVFGPSLSVGQILDFLKGAPRLLEVTLGFATPTIANAPPGRLVALPNLEKLNIIGTQPPVLLLGHLVIPVGAKVSTQLDHSGPDIDDHLPESLDNLKNLSNFTKIRLKYEHHFASIRITGPNGEVTIASSSPGPTAPEVVLRSLARLDTSRTRCLEIIKGGPITDSLLTALQPMQDLRTLIISRCGATLVALLSLDPSFSQNGLVECPKLEELVFHTYEPFGMAEMAHIAEARALKGAPLKSVKIVSFGEPVSTDGAEELLRHVPDVEVNEVDDEEYYFGTGDDDED